MTAGGVAIAVLAKAPRPGFVKTRLSPPFSPEQAASMARAALLDTLRAVLAARAPRRALVLSGEPRPWTPHGFDVIPQRGTGLDERIAAAFEDVGGPALLIGMDTPQVTPGLLDACIGRLQESGVQAVVGLAEDGGFWAVGLRRPDPGAFVGVPMSTARTGTLQERRLLDLGLRVARLPTLRDVDEADDARAVAALAPSGLFAASVRDATRARPAASLRR